MKYEGIDFKPTEAMAEEAQRALDWRKEGNRGGTPVGVARARQLVNRQNLSPRTVRRMFSFFSRHAVDKEAEGFSPGEEGYPSPGRVAWGLWGGDAGFSWARARVSQMNNQDEKNISSAISTNLRSRVREHNKNNKGKGKRVTYNMLAQVFKRGIGAYETNPESVRPTVTSPEQWAYARVDSFLYAVRNGKFRSGKHDTDLLPKGHPMRTDKMYGVLGAKIKSVSEDSNYITIRGMASTKDADRVGDIMEPDCWTKGGLDNYMKNPIILFNHDYNRPIGRGADIKVTNNGLELTAKISKADKYISQLIQDGVLSTFSVGFKIREADYMKETGGLYIKDAELYEVSVVSVPANQAATFEVVKCFSPTEFELYKSGLITPKGERETKVSEKEINMNEEELKALIAKQTAAAVKMALAEKEVADKKAAEEKAAKEAEQTKLDEVKAQVAIAKSGTEKLLEEVKATFEASKEATQAEIEGLKAALKDRAEEVKALQSSKRQFLANGTTEWKKAAEADLRDAYMLGKISEKGWNTSFGQNVINKVNEMSGLAVSTATVAAYETVVSTAIERDIQNELILATLFREIPMTSAAMALPILPDAGYAEFISTKVSANTGGDAPHGNLEERGDTEGSPYAGIDLGSKTLTTKKLVSLTFLANETEEDAILPILPLINESMVRAHARAVERAMLRGSSAIGSFDGLTTIATANSDVVTNTTAFASDALTSDHLIGLRKAMGKYGVRPSEVVYIVSERAYFELLEDPEFKDVSLVGQAATKLRGEIGNVYGSRVVLCDEYVAPALNQFFAVAVNPRNFVVPRLRGATLESQYVPRLQHRELIATQRLGFEQIIDGASAVTARKYHSA